MLMFILGFVSAIIAMAMYAVCAINSTDSRAKEEKELHEWIQRKERDR